MGWYGGSEVRERVSVCLEVGVLEIRASKVSGLICGEGKKRGGGLMLVLSLHVTSSLHHTLLLVKHYYIFSIALLTYKM